MPDIDSLAFQIAFAMTQKTGGETKRLIRSLPDAELDRLAQVVADHLRLCRWQRPPAEPKGPSPAWTQGRRRDSPGDCRQETRMVQGQVAK